MGDVRGGSHVIVRRLALLVGWSHVPRALPLGQADVEGIGRDRLHAGLDENSGTSGNGNTEKKPEPEPARRQFSTVERGKARRGDRGLLRSL